MGHVFRHKKENYLQDEAKGPTMANEKSTWMEDNGYPAVDSEKIFFMKRSGHDFFIQGIFVDDMKHVPASQLLFDKFLKSYSRDFDITVSKHLMESFIGLEVEQSKSKISLHLEI